MFQCGSVTLQCCWHPVCARHRRISARACLPSISDIGSWFPIYIEWEPLSVLGSNLKREFQTRWVLRKMFEMPVFIDRVIMELVARTQSAPVAKVSFLHGKSSDEITTRTHFPVTPPLHHFTAFAIAKAGVTGSRDVWPQLRSSGQSQETWHVNKTDRLPPHR